MQLTAEAIWREFEPQLARFIRRRLDDPHAVDDVLQEVYLKIHRHIDGLRHHDRRRAWVYQITRHTIMDYYRTRRPQIPVDDDLPDDALGVEVTDEIKPQLLRSIRQMMDYLPEEYREALLLTTYREMTQQELADHLGISLSGAKSRVQRGRKLLRELLLNCCRFEFDRRGQVIDYSPYSRCCVE